MTGAAQTDGAQTVVVRQAVWPQDAPEAAALLRGYLDFLHNGPAALDRQHIDDHERELADLSAVWGGGQAALLLAWRENVLLGCVGVRILPDNPHAAEIKRLWTEPHARGVGLGRLLIEAAIEWARCHSARELLLDTLPASMPEAQRLYRAMGFQECERYNTNPVPGTIYFSLRIG